MIIEPRKLEGTFEITLNRIGDSRGYFMETFSQKKFAANGLENNWVQENQSLSSQIHTLRGLHFQYPPFAQAKLVSVVQGEIRDVFVDLRPDSSTFGEWDSIELSAENCKSIFVPRGFAHGFCTLTETVVVQYKVDNPYSPEHEQGIRWDDPDLRIEWGAQDPYLSNRDSNLPFFADLISSF